MKTMKRTIRTIALIAMTALLFPLGAFAAKADKVDVIMVYKAKPDAAEKARVKGLGGETLRDFENFDMRVIRVSENALKGLGKGKGVEFIVPDREIFSMAATLSTSAKTGPSAAHLTANVPSEASKNGYYDGYGVGVAIIDSGVGQHMDLASSIRQYDFVNGAFPRPERDDGELESYRDSPRWDGLGHGTHVAGIVSGSGAASNGQYVGAATDAKLLALRVLDGEGRGVASDAIAALDWLLSYGRYFDIKVVNLSIGKGVEESYATDPLVLAVERVWDAGMVVVVSAGNFGNDGNMTVTSPANSRKVITVGSLTDSGTGYDFSDDYASTYSSMGPTLGDHVVKPDLIAPGNRVISTVPLGAMLLDGLPDRVAKCRVGEESYAYCSANYLELSGTSMAAPLVSAAVARMLDKDSSLSPATIKARLMRSARKFGGDLFAVGAGVLDVEAAMNESGVVYGDALSPLTARSEEGPVLLLEDTAKLWGDETWGSAYLWSNGYLWTNSYNWYNGYLWTDAYLWSNSYLWTNAYLWTFSYLWTNAYLWTNGYLWTEAVTNYNSLYEVSGTHIQLNDD
jgi:serine protease AprX